MSKKASQSRRSKRAFNSEGKAMWPFYTVRPCMRARRFRRQVNKLLHASCDTTWTTLCTVTCFLEFLSHFSGNF